MWNDRTIEPRRFERNSHAGSLGYPLIWLVRMWAGITLWKSQHFIFIGDKCLTKRKWKSFDLRCRVECPSNNWMIRVLEPRPPMPIRHLWLYWRLAHNDDTSKPSLLRWTPVDVIITQGFFTNHFSFSFSLIGRDDNRIDQSKSEKWHKNFTNFFMENWIRIADLWANRIPWATKALSTANCKSETWNNCGSFHSDTQRGYLWYFGLNGWKRPIWADRLNDGGRGAFRE